MNPRLDPLHRINDSMQWCHVDTFSPPPSFRKGEKKNDSFYSACPMSWEGSEGSARVGPPRGERQCEGCGDACLRIRKR